MALTMHTRIGAGEEGVMVEAIRDQWVIVAAVVLIAALIAWRFLRR